MLVGAARAIGVVAVARAADRRPRAAAAATPSSASTPTTNAPAAHHRTKPKRVQPRSVTVAVLNGTADAGLAAEGRDAAWRRRLQAGDTIANATNQTRTATVVAYLPGSQRRAHRTSPPRSSSASARSSRSTRQHTGGRLSAAPTACTANVVVTVGADLAEHYRTPARPMADLLDLPERSAKPRQRRDHARARPWAVGRRGRWADRGGRRRRSTWSSSAGAPRSRTGNLSPSSSATAQLGIPVVLGGTLTELAIAQGRLEPLIAWLHELGPRAHRDLRRHDHDRARRQARTDRAAGAASSRCSPRSAPRTTPRSWPRTGGSSRSRRSSRPGPGR